MSVEPNVDSLITRMEIDKSDFQKQADEVQKKLNTLAKSIQTEMGKAEQAAARSKSAIKQVAIASNAEAKAVKDRMVAEKRADETRTQMASVAGKMAHARTAKETEALKKQYAELKKIDSINKVSVPASRNREALTRNGKVVAERELARAAQNAAAAQAASPDLKAREAQAMSRQKALDDKRGQHFAYANSTQGQIAFKSEKKRQAEAVADGVEAATRKSPREAADRIIASRDRQKTVNDLVKKEYSERELAERRSTNQSRYFSGPMGRLRQYFNSTPSEAYLNTDHEAVGKVIGKTAGKLTGKGLAALGVDASVAAELGALMGPIGLLVGGVLALGTVIKDSVKYTAELVKSLNIMAYRALESGQNSVSIAAAGQMSEAWGGSQASAQQSAVNLEHSLYGLRTGAGPSSELMAMARYGVHPMDATGNAVDQLQLGQEIAQSLENRPWMSKAFKFQAMKEMGLDDGRAHLIAELGLAGYNAEMAKQEERTKKLGPAIQDANEATRKWTEGTQAFRDAWAENIAPIFSKLEGAAGSALEAVFGEKPKINEKSKLDFNDDGPDELRNSMDRKRSVTPSLISSATTKPALTLASGGVPSPVPLGSSQNTQAAQLYALSANQLQSPQAVNGTKTIVYDNSFNMKDAHIAGAQISNPADFAKQMKQTAGFKKGLVQADGN